MSRLVQPRTTVPPAAGPADAAKYGIERVVKYVPSELVGIYLFVGQSLAGAKPGTEQAHVANELGLWFAVLLWAACPFYFYWQREPDKPYRANMIMATVTFPVWAFAVGPTFHAVREAWPFVPQVLLGLVFLLALFVKPEQ